MSWESWGWGKSLSEARQEAAYLFLNTGQLTPPLKTPSECIASSQCAVGYACVNGKCQPTSGPAGGTGGSNLPTPQFPQPGDCGSGPDSPSGGLGGCSSPNNDRTRACTTATCGQDGPNYGSDTDCCGERCCRFTAAEPGPVVNCRCGGCYPNYGPCSENSDCNSNQVCVNGRCTDRRRCVRFCDHFYKTNGYASPACPRDNGHCDECSECGTDNYCGSKSDTPCHCEGNNLSECEVCNNDGSISRGQCQSCCTTQVYCKCGQRLSATVCTPVEDYTGPTNCNLAADAASRQCEIDCQGDSCEGTTQNCVGKTLCKESGSCEDDFDPILEDGHYAKVTGCIKNEDTGELCFLYDDCDTTALPANCSACDCNCHNDCPYCELCGADGKCYPDPECEGDWTTTWFRAGTSYTIFGCTYNPQTGEGGCVDPTERTTSDVNITGTGPMPHSLVMTREPTLTPYGPCVSGNLVSCWRLKDANGTWISSEQCTVGTGGTFCADVDLSDAPKLVSAEKV